VAFKFFSRSTSSYIAPAGIAPGLHTKPAAQRPLDTPKSTALAAELDMLSVFLPEDSSSMSARARARVAENLQAASRYAAVVDLQDASDAAQIDAKRLDDFRKLFRQTRQTVEQLKGDASAVRGELSELRSLGEHLGQGYTRLGDICRLTEKRSELTVDVLNAIEKRIEPLEVVRELSATTEVNFASLKQLAEEVMQCGARFEAQKEAIDRAREEATRVGRVMEELQARVALLTEKTEWLGEAEATVGRLEHRAFDTTAQLERRATATMAELERRLDGFDGRKRDIVRALDAACADSNYSLAQAEETVGWLEQQAAETTAQLERRVSHFAAQEHTIEQALATVLTDGDQKLAHAQETVSRLEHQGRETAAQVERRVSHFEAQKLAIEQALATVLTESDQKLAHAQEMVRRLEHEGIETAAQLEHRVRHFDAERHTIELALAAAVTGSDKELRRAEETAGRLERRAAASMDQLERRIDNFDVEKSTIERAAAEARRVTAVLSALAARVAALTGSDGALGQAETAIVQLERRSTGSSRSAVWMLKIRRPYLRWAAVLGVLVAVNVLGIVTLLKPDQPRQLASNARAALQESPAPVTLLPSTPLTPLPSTLPSTLSHFAMFDMPAGRPIATTGTMSARHQSSPDRRDRPRVAPAARATDVSQAGRSKEPLQYVGTLTVDSQPAGSAVFVDRQLVGETPLELPRLRAGSHVVRIERDGFDRWTTAVHVAADRQTRVSAGLQAVRDR